MSMRKQDDYYDFLIKQTKREHQEQMKVYQVQLEADENNANFISHILTCAMHKK